MTLEMKKRGHPAETIDKLIYQNPLKFPQPMPEVQAPLTPRRRLVESGQAQMTPAILEFSRRIS